MKIDFNVSLKDLRGKALVSETKELITLRMCAVNAVLALGENDHDMLGEEKVRRWKLAKLIYDGDKEIEISTEDIALVKKLIAKVYAPLVVGQAWEILER